MTHSCTPSRLAGRLRAPASKSSMQRAVACAALAPGTSVLGNPSDCADARAALGIARALGAGVRETGAGIEIDGGILAKAPPSRPGHPRRLSCGESGLCLRMFSPIAALLPGETELGAEGSLRRRPVTTIEGSIDSLGGRATTQAGLPPVLVQGPLRGGRAQVDASTSSQFLTGLLIALPCAAVNSELVVSNIVSSGYVDLTLDTMAAFGVGVLASPDRSAFAVAGGQAYRARAFEVEGDWSGAAFLLVAAAMAGREGGAGDPAGLALRLDGLKLDSTQPDRAILEVLRLAGAQVVELPGSPSGSVLVGRRELSAFGFDATNCPDLFPPLVALASVCRGVSVLTGARRLASKESDRARALKEEFGSLGIAVEVDGDRMLVTGGRPAGGRVDSRGDHRIAMAAAVAGLAATGEVLIDGAECVAKSWPGFFGDLASLTSLAGLAGRG